MNKYSSKSDSLQCKYSKMKPIDQQTQIQVSHQVGNQVINQVSDQVCYKVLYQFEEQS